MIKLRPYQQDFISNIRKSIHSGNTRIIAAASTGSGKAVCIASIALSALDKGSRVVVVLPRRSLVLQLSETFKHYNIKHGIIMSNIAEFRHEKCQIISIDTYVARVANGRLDHVEGKVLLVDECFTGETEILTINGVKRIDEIEIGDKILSAVGNDEVISVFKKRVNETIKIGLSNGKSIECTSNHPIFTEQGWVEAGRMAVGQVVICRENMLSLWCDNETIQVQQRRKQRIKYLHRDRRELSWSPGKAAAGQEKRHPTEIVRVESIENNKHGSRNFVYNIGVKNHPSYFANGVLAHNCHAQFTEKKLEIFRKYPIVVSFSATPIAPKNAPLNVFYDAIVESISMKELVKQGYLVPLKYYAPADFHSDSVKTNRDGEYNESSLREYINEKLKDEDGNTVLIGDVYKNWKRLAPERQTVIFCSTQAHALGVTNEFLSKGVKAEYVDCYTDDDERQRIFKAIESGTSQVVVNCSIISMGIDVPILSCVVLAAPTNSIARYLQAVGRATRLHKSKTHSIIIDHCGIVAKLGFADDDQYWSLDGKETPEERKEQAKKEKKEPKEITCKECQFIYKSRRDCPQCGFESIPLGEPIPFYEEELVEVKKTDTPAYKAEFYAMLLGMKRGEKFALALFMQRFKQWPNKKRGVKPIQPSQGLINYVTSRNIAYAKRRR